MEWGPISAQGVTTTLKTMLNLKASGRDQIANFLLKQLTLTHKCLATVLTKLIKEYQIPEWLQTGVTTLTPKL